MDVRTLAVTVFFAMPCLAGSTSGEDATWDFDSIRPASNQGSTAGQGVYAALQDMLASWNAHDIVKYLTFFSNTPELLIVSDQQVISGWKALHDSYAKGYENPEEMGFMTPDRIQIRLIRPDLAFALTTWTQRFPLRREEVYGLATWYLQKTDSGWKIISGHSSVAQL